VSADNPPKPNTLSIWRRRINIGTTGMPVGLFSILLTLLTVPALGESISSLESDQQISDFTLTGYGERGKKAWDISGKTADIFTEVVKLKNVIGNLYGKQENIKLTSDRGDFNKTDGLIHLEQNVIITTSSGTRLNTDSLDWDRKNQLVATNDRVNIERDNMVIVASGARGNPDLKKVSLEKDVRLDINPAKKNKGQNHDPQDKIIITCDGPLAIDYEKNVATFNNNVRVDKQDSAIYSDKMDVFFIPSGKEEKDSDFMGTNIDKIIARGDVRIVRGENISYSDEALYTFSDKKIVLTGRPKLIMYSTEGLGGTSP